jgi:hypothetical protein
MGKHICARHHSSSPGQARKNNGRKQAAPELVDPCAGVHREVVCHAAIFRRAVDLAGDTKCCRLVLSLSAAELSMSSQPLINNTQT